jgi:hypothetical protein
MSSLTATSGRDLANEERARWDQPPIPRPSRASRYRAPPNRPVWAKAHSGCLDDLST